MKTLLNIATLAFAALLAICMTGKPLFKRDPDEAPAPKTCLTKDFVKRTEFVGVRKCVRANGLTKFHFKNDRISLEIWAKDLESATRKFLRKTQALTIYHFPMYSMPHQGLYYMEAEFAV